VLHNPIHAEIANPRLFEVEVSGNTKNDNGMKRGFQKMRLVKEIPLPKITQEQRIRYGILCVKAIYIDSAFVVWADRWLSGEDRTKAAAADAAWAAWAAAQEVARAAWTTETTEVAAWAAEAAAWAAWTAETTEVAAWTAWAAAWAAWAARAAAAWASKSINLIKLAEQAVAK
jgi:hypothetical protein